MKLIPEELIKEKRSTINLRQVLMPWQVFAPEDDTGIDLIVWPYTGDKERSPDNRQVYVQLKSTTRDLSTLPIASLSIDVEHIIGWKNLVCPVVLILNDLNNDSFYFCWISDIDVIEKQKTQTIVFSDKFKMNDTENLKAYILRKVYPVKIIKKSYSINADGSPGIVASLGELKGIANASQLDLEKIIPEINKDISDFQRLMRLQEAQTQMPNRAHEFSYEICGIHLRSNDTKNAVAEIAKVANGSNYAESVRAKIILSAINESDESLLSIYSDWKSALYFQFERNTARQNVDIVFDGKSMKLEIIDGSIVVFPDIEFKEVKFNVSEFREFGRIKIRMGLYINSRIIKRHSVEFNPM